MIKTFTSSGESCCKRLNIWLRVKNDLVFELGSDNFFLNIRHYWNEYERDFLSENISITIEFDKL